jgi:hypothetical protein
MKTLTTVIMQTIPKADPESRLTDFAVRTPASFRKLLVYCESGFRKPFIRPLAGSSKPDVSMNILSSSSVTHQKGFHIQN